MCSLEGIDPQNREAWISGVRRTSQLQLTPRNWETICCLNIKPGLSKSQNVTYGTPYCQNFSMVPLCDCRTPDERIYVKLLSLKLPFFNVKFQFVVITCI